MKCFSIGIVFASLCISVTYASWQNPVLLTELNDFENGLAATRPTISSDENTILFVRGDSNSNWRLWQAERNLGTGVFNPPRMVTELKNAGKDLYGAWMSADKLRLYYACPDPANLGWTRRPIWMAMRSNPNETWQTIKRHTELETTALLHCPTLTADENLILWEAQGSGTDSKWMIASRPSLLHSFSNVQEVTELDAIGAKSVLMSPDGLKVYFVRLGDRGLDEYWEGSRDSLADPFGGFSSISEINMNTTVNALGWISPTWDGTKLYYHHRRDVIGDVYTCGIYMSEWVDDSYPDMIACIERATAKKQEALRLLTEASQEEQTAYGLMTTLTPQQMPPTLTHKSLTEAMKNLERSMAKQEQVISVLEGCVRNLQASLFFLLPPLSAQP